MSLPTINVPQYEVTLPSTKENVTYRPFLVREEKILLLALEDGGDKALAMALKQIVNNCTFEKLPVNDLPLFDLEFMFLRIRSKSVGEVADLKLLCEDDGETYADVSIPLDDINIEFPEGHDPVVKLNDEVTLMMSYPTFEMLGTDMQTMDVEKTFDLICSCIKQVIEGETIHEKSDWNKKELGSFLDSLTSKQFADVQKFFETMPKLSYEVEFVNPKTKEKNKMTLEGLQSFFV